MTEEQKQEIQRRDAGPLASIKAGLFCDGSVNMIADVLPGIAECEAKKAALRFVKVAYAYISTNDYLQRCTMPSIIRCVAQSASVGLEVDGRGLAYLVPFKNKNGQLEAQYIIGYKGLMELAYRSNKVKSISANVIYASEKNNVKIERIDGRYNVEHPFCFEEPSGAVIAAYACAEIEGLGPQSVVLRRDEIERHRNASKAPDSPAWRDWYPEMAMKTAIRVLSRYLPKAILDEMSRAIATEDNDDFVTASQLNEAIIAAQSGTKKVDARISDGPPRDDDSPEPTFLGPDAEADPGTQAEAAKQKQALEKDQTSVVPGKFVCKNPKCSNAGGIITNPEMVPRGRARTMVPQCPECLRTNLEAVEDEAA